MEIRGLFGIIAAMITVIGYIPYFRDVFAKKTKPHLYTWLVWGLTQGTATIALVRGGGKWGAISLLVGTILVAVVFFLCFTYSTKNITRSDTNQLDIAAEEMIINGKSDTTDWKGKHDIEDMQMSGFIAQEVEEAAHTIGYDFSGVDAPDSDHDLYALRYAEFVVPLVK